jgi:hypothetical protein
MDDFIEFRTPPSICRCGRPLDAAAPTGHTDRPTPGAISICAYCGRLQMYDDDLKLRTMTEDELREVMASDVGPMLRFAQHKVQELRHRAKD